MSEPKVTLRPFDTESVADCELMAKWENDPEIRHFFQFFPNEESTQRVATAASVAEECASPKDRSLGAHFMVLLDAVPVGNLSFFMDRPPILWEKLKTAWIGIVIGEARARGAGVGRRAMELLELEIRAVGAERIELGVFEFNEAALRLYRGLGYREFTRLPNFTYHAGRMWDDVRMIKEFV